MTRLKIIAVSSLAIAAGLAGCASQDGMGKQDQTMNANYGPSGDYMRESSAGRIMTTPDGMTVYTFDQDVGGTSTCYGDCAEEWPPVTAAGDAQAFGEMTIVERTDGTRQWAYDGKPLYLYHDDNAPGEVEGDGEGGVWHVVK
jgi:predicted lipoprotein with Yx(FWY)xxD motif